LQATGFGAEIKDVDVSEVDLSKEPFQLKYENKPIDSQAIILATGASARWLGLKSEQRLIGAGVSSCATCDGFFFKNKEVAVVGGGDAAMEEALFLTKFASKVTVLVRRDQLRASKIMQKRAKAHPKINFLWNSEVKEVMGAEKVESLKIINNSTHKLSVIKVDGLFVAIGHKPNTDFLKGQIELDKKGYTVVHEQTRTSVEGVFVAGDVRDFHYRQAITAAGLGSMAAIDAERWLAQKGLISEEKRTAGYGA